VRGFLSKPFADESGMGETLKAVESIPIAGDGLATEFSGWRDGFSCAGTGSFGLR